MSLRKSPILTPARLNANRRNAAGPRTARGKARSRLNGIRTGSRSKEYVELREALAWAEPGAVLREADFCLTPAQQDHALFTEMVEIFRKVEMQMIREAATIKLSGAK